MLPAAFLFILAKTIFEAGPIHSQSLKASENPLPINSNVTLSTQNAVTVGAWLFNNSIIVIMYPGQQIVSDKWKDRVTLSLTQNHTSLTMASVQVEDSGEYKLQQFQGNSQEFSIQLSVQEYISNVTIKAQATNLVEFNDSAVFTCAVSKGTSLSYAWLNGSSVIGGGERVQLSDGGANLTVRVTRYDQGPFSCNVSNDISHEASPSVHLNISYGPSSTRMILMPAGHAYRLGDNITLSCSADSNPAAKIMWMFNGMDLNKTGSPLQLQNITESKSGNYTCMFYNAVTSRFASETKMIRILTPVTEASVQIVGSQPVLNHTFTLTCQTTGTVESITWMHSWSPLYSNVTRILSMDDKTLTFNPVMMSDNGIYSCMASNSISNRTSEWFLLDVFYGPEMAWISGPPVVKMGENVTLTCSAPSRPPSSYKWMFNGSVVAETSTYVTPPFTAEMNGMYTCMAYNNFTNKSSTAHKMIIALYPITDVQIDSPMKAAIEGHPYKLTCNVTGPPDPMTVDVHWFKNGYPPQSDNETLFFTDYNTSIVFSPLQRAHSGNYTCRAMNTVSTVTSPPYMLRVKFGPESAVITGPDYAELGAVAHFNCSAISYPPSRFTWWFNGSQVANTSMFTTPPLSFNMSGEYTCVAYNDVTGGKNSTSTVLTVVEATKLMITSSGVPIHYQNFSLTCEVTGPYDDIYWVKDDMPLNTSEANYTMSYPVENNTLTFTPVTFDNEGVYKCVASNHAGEHPSPPFHLLVNYGPLRVDISGPGSAHMGSTVTLTCFAVSRPECEFFWYIDSSAAVLQSGSAVTFPATKQHEGTYTCMARNPVTNITLHQTKVFVLGKGAALCAPSYGVLSLLSVFAFSLTALFN